MAPKQCDKQRTQTPRPNQSWPPKQTDNTKRFIWLGWGGADRRAKTKETKAPQACREERLATQAPKQARKQNTETKQPQVFSPTATDPKARAVNQFNNPRTKRPREAQRPRQSKPSPPSQPDSATGPTSICLFVLVCVVWACSPKVTETKARPPNQFNKQKTQRPR